MPPRLRRRSLLAALGLAMPGWSAAARGLTPIPPQTEGPFYPQPADRPADTDRDLVKIEGAVREAGGEVLHLTGRVVGPGGKPLPGRAVEIWQCDAGGRYHHPRDGCAAERDPAFQGFGRTVTDGEGGFRFRTIRPVPYPGRTPHIHARIARPDGTWLTTQLYVAGDPGNARDWIFRRLGARGQAAASMELARNAGGDWETAIDIVL